MKNFLLLLLLTFSIQSVLSNDTLTVMQYNLMYYGKYTDFCTSLNNNVSTKTLNLKTILSYVQPDIFTVNELDEQAYDADNILNNALNVDGATKYARALLKGDYLVNMLYYNQEKLGLVWQKVINTSPRITDVYKLYYKTPDLNQYSDTTYLHCFVIHMKAGTASGDEYDRSVAAQKIMDYINESNIRTNFLVMGDMNFYGNDEVAFQTFTNYSNLEIQLKDPIDEVGAWNNNYNYRFVHTQSTHSSNTGCFSYGGMDDRFDFIFSSENLLNDNNDVNYIPNSYHALGQDGMRFNESINIPLNNSIPTDLADALYNMSDHLPVILKLEINPNLSSISERNIAARLIFNNPIQDILNLEILQEVENNFEIFIYAITGQLIYSQKYSSENSRIQINLNKVQSGLYILKYKSDNIQLTHKIIIK